VMILAVSHLMGFRVRSLPALLLGLVFMVLISVTFLGLGLIFASRMRDMQGFSIVMNFVIFPLFFLSGALYPLDNFPGWLRVVSHLDPLTFGVDGLRGVLIGVSRYHPLLDLGLMLAFSVVMIGLGTWFFETSESL
jgi:ABC-2 type transport system permease protein